MDTNVSSWEGMNALCWCIRCCCDFSFLYSTDILCFVECTGLFLSLCFPSSRQKCCFYLASAGNGLRRNVATHI